MPILPVFQLLVQQHLDRGGYAFHWNTDPVPPRLQLHLHQQDALRHSWEGLVAGTDGSVDERTEQMGGAYVLGVESLLIQTPSWPSPPE